MKTRDEVEKRVQKYEITDKFLMSCDYFVHRLKAFPLICLTLVLLLRICDDGEVSMKLLCLYSYNSPECRWLLSNIPISGELIHSNHLICSLSLRHSTWIGILDRDISSTHLFFSPLPSS